MAILKTITADIQESVVSVYDQTKTTIAGFTYAQVINGVTVLAPPLVKWVDIFIDSGETVTYASLTSNGRLFCMTAPSGGLARILCFDFNLMTGVAAYRGKISVSLPSVASTTHTVRGFRADDSNVNEIKIFFATSGSVTINGGTFVANKIAIADFAPVGFPTIGFAVGSNTRGIYFLQDPFAVGAGQLNIASAGMAIDSVSQKLYIHNGNAATHQYFVYDYSIAPNCPQSIVTISIAVPAVVSLTAHGLNNNDQVAFTTTGALPTGISVGTVYFVRNATANTYEISATSGGGAITTTGTQSGVHSASRAFGISTANFSFKTGNLPLLTGALLINNSEAYMTPGHSINSGSPCLFFATNNALYIGKVSDLTSLSTSWNSLITSNLLGSVNQVVAPTAINATWNHSLDRAVFITSVTKMIAKKIVNNQYEDIFGVLNNDYLEGVLPSNVITQFGAITVTEFASSNGWTFLLGSSVGQRGLLALNSGASYRAGTTYIITKVIDTPNTLQYAVVDISTQLAAFSGSSRISYRTSGFGSASGGWILLPANNLLSAILPVAQIQFKIEFNPSDISCNNMPAIIEVYLSLLESFAISDNWSASVANSSQPSASPFYAAFRLAKTYATIVPKIFVTVVDDSGAVSRYDTVTNAALFNYSTNNGTTWNALGIIPNTALTTELRLNIVSPSGNPITCGILEY